jgi:hypothetical protein
MASELLALAAWIDQRLADETADRQAIAESVSARLKNVVRRTACAAERVSMTAPGPFETDRGAMDHPAVRAIRTAMRESTRRGVGDEMCHRLLDEACSAAGVQLGAYDHRIVQWLAGWEPEVCIVVAGLVARAAGGTGGCLRVAGRRVAAAREYLDAIRPHPVSGRPHSVLVREDAELRRVLGQVLDCITEAAGTQVSGMSPGGAAVLSQADLPQVLGALAAAAGLHEERAAGYCDECRVHPAELCGEHAGDLEAATAYRALAVRLGEDR